MQMEGIAGGGRSGSTTIAFTLSYEGKDPSTVQKVTNSLASLFLARGTENKGKAPRTTTDLLSGGVDEP